MNNHGYDKPTAKGYLVVGLVFVLGAAIATAFGYSSFCLATPAGFATIIIFMIGREAYAALWLDRAKTP